VEKIFHLLCLLEAKKDKVMREFKFRAWGVKNKVMYQVVRLECANSGKSAMLGVATFDPHNGYEEHETSSSEIELMQYTGIQDNAGKDIYEGDILRSKSGKLLTPEYMSIPADFYNRKCFVVGGWAFHSSDEDYEDCPLESKIVGNIYENPQLKYELERQVRDFSRESNSTEQLIVKA